LTEGLYFWLFAKIDKFFIEAEMPRGAVGTIDMLSVIRVVAATS
jgi:hypothetical protein